MKTPVSVVIIAKNEEGRIEDCLKSVHGWCDEIIIVDDESIDRTREIAGQYTEKIFTRRMDLEGRQRNYGADQAKNEWIMILDCDERATDAVKKEVDEVLSNPDEEAGGYWVPQICYVGNVQLKHGGWSAPHIRVYSKNRIRWREIPQDVVHPGLDMGKGYKAVNLQNPLIHYNYASFEDFIRKVNRQSTLEAIKWHIDGRKMGMGRAMWRTIDRFFRRFLGKKGHKDGYYGFVAAVLSGFYEFAAYSKLREIRERGAYLKEYGIDVPESQQEQGS